eukprot:94417-Chlamydomonas_euryale.AAC.1
MLVGVTQPHVQREAQPARTRHVLLHDRRRGGLRARAGVAVVDRACAGAARVMPQQLSSLRAAQSCVRWGGVSPWWCGRTISSGFVHCSAVQLFARADAP